MSSVQDVLSCRCDYHNAGKIQSGCRLVGVMMKKIINSFGLITAGLVFLSLPILVYFTGDTTGRTILKDSLSLLTLLAFVLMIGQFYLARTMKLPIEGATAGRVISIHILVGYLGTAILLVHPLLIVVPRFFESGIHPYQAFTTMITTNTPGVVTGVVAWILLLLISSLSFMRGRIPLKYREWRRIHGVMSTAFIFLASWHAIYLGRHINQPLSAYIAIQAAVGILFLIQRYISDLYRKGERRQWVLPEKSTACPGEIS